MRLIPIIISLLCGIGGAAFAQTAFTPLSNLGQPSGGNYATINPSAGLIVSFTTGDFACGLAAVHLTFDPALGESGNGVSVAVWSDTNGLPASLLATLSGPLFPYNGGTFEYDSSPPLTLATNTAYWLYVSTSDPIGYRWSVSATTNVDAGSIWTLGTSAPGTPGNWQRFGYYYPQFSVVVTNVIPPPVSIAAIPAPTIFLRFEDPGLPYVIQQSTNMAQGVWTGVSNILWSATISNEATFILHPAPAQTFYRLELN